jgi:RES domain-containing protein
MHVWRLCKAEHEDLSGTGAFIYGGRWNSEGHNVVYTASHLSLACLESLVGLPQLRIPKGFIFLKLFVSPDIKRAEFKGDLTQIRKRDYCQKIGNAWLIQGEAAVLVVPSVIVPQENNVLINPRHPDAQKIEVLEKTPFEFDPRLLR